MTKILATGMSSLIGGVVREQLADGYELSALNRRPVDGVRAVQAESADFDAMRQMYLVSHHRTAWSLTAERTFDMLRSGRIHSESPSHL